MGQGSRQAGKPALDPMAVFKLLFFLEVFSLLSFRRVFFALLFGFSCGFVGGVSSSSVLCGCFVGVAVFVWGLFGFPGLFR